MTARWRYLWRWVRPYKLSSVALLGIGVLTVATEAINPVLYKLIFDTVVGSEVPDQVWPTLVLLLLALLGATLLHNVVRHVDNLFLAHLESSVLRDASVQIFTHLQALSFDYHASRRAGGLMKDMSRGVEAIENILDRLWIDFFPLTCRLLIIMGIFTTLAWDVTLAMVLGVLGFLFVSLTLRYVQAPRDRERNRIESRMHGALAENLGNQATVKYFGAGSREIEKFAGLGEEWCRSQFRLWRSYGLIGFTQGMAAVLIEVVLLWLSLRHWRDGTFTVGDIAFVQGYLLQLILPLFDFGRRVQDFFRALTNLDDAVEILESPTVPSDTSSARPLLLREGRVEFRHLSFAYSEGRTVLEGIDLTLMPGEKVALVGHSGAGKSTIVKLLFRFYDPTEGALLIDGQDLLKVQQHSIRQQIGIVPQEPTLFHTTLRENIAYGVPSATVDQIERVARLAHAHEFIQRFPKGLETVVGERGMKLSAGERQRIAIARALLVDAKILVLDEATSSLDSASEKLIQDALHNLIQGRTALVIAHRLSTIMEMDRIIVLEGGRIREQGSHTELLKREGGIYRSLWELQAGGFLPE